MYTSKFGNRIKGLSSPDCPVCECTNIIAHSLTDCTMYHFHHQELGEALFHLDKWLLSLFKVLGARHQSDESVKATRALVKYLVDNGLVTIR